jgi:hypothetical protein
MDHNRMRPLLAALLLALALPAIADDPAAQAQLIRQQQSEAFSLQLQQSIQSLRSGNLTPAQRLELESLQRDQRLRQSDTFYRQQVQQSQVPPAPGASQAELMRSQQQNAADVSRARDEGSAVLEQAPLPPKPAPNPEPAVIWGPVLR